MSVQSLNVVSVEQVSPEILQIVNDLAKALRPKRIVLFGSRVYGVVHADSDIDLLIVMDHLPHTEIRYQLARDMRRKDPLQLVFMRDIEFEETKDVVGGIAYPAHHWGRVLYAENS